MLALLFVVGLRRACARRHRTHSFWQAVFRWLHVFFGILWIGLLYYFNFVQIRKMPDIPAELKPAISKYIAPEALFWFRWAALVTVAGGRHHRRPARLPCVEVLTFGLAGGFDRRPTGPSCCWAWACGWRIIMFLNVWVFIWPNQKIALGIVEADADAKAKAGRRRRCCSRAPTCCCRCPMLTTMTMNQTLFG